MKKFLYCELFTFIKFIGLLIVVNIIVLIIGASLYSKTIFLGSILAIVMFVIVFIWKFIRILILPNISQYQCTQSNTFKKALTWISNIV